MSTRTFVSDDPKMGILSSKTPHYTREVTVVPKLNSVFSTDSEMVK